MPPRDAGKGSMTCWKSGALFSRPPIGNERPLKPLKHPPSDGVSGECRRRSRSGLVGDRSCVRRFHVDFGHPLGHHKPSDRFLHRAADREQAVVAQDAELLVAERAPKIEGVVQCLNPDSTAYRCEVRS